MASFAHLCSQLADLLALNERLLDEISEIKVVQAGMAEALKPIACQREASGDDLLEETEMAPPQEKVEDFTKISMPRPPPSAVRSESQTISQLPVNATLTVELQKKYRKSLGEEFLGVSSMFGFADHGLSVLQQPNFRFDRFVEEKAGAIRTSCDLGQNQLMNRVCNTVAFELCVASVTFLNTVFMCYEADVAIVAHLDGKEYHNFVFDVVNLLFCIAFTIELIMKLLAYGCLFFHGPAKFWNLLDVAIVAAAVRQLFFLRKKSGVDLAFFRASRAFKVSKVLRAIKLFRFLRELRVLLSNMLQSMRALIWSIVLIVIVLFVLSLAFLQGFSTFLQDKDKDVSPEMHSLIEKRWGSTAKGMLTLYMTTTGGMDWDDASEVLWQLHPFYYGAFLLYVSFFMFVIANCITALIVDQALQVSARDAAELVEDDLCQKTKFLHDVEELFDGMQKDAEGNVTAEEFTRHWKDASLIAFCSKMNIQPCELIHFFSALSGSGTRSIDMHTFVVGCIKLRGHAKSADVISIMVELRDFRRSVADFKVFCEEELSAIHYELHAFRSNCSTSTSQQENHGKLRLDANYTNQQEDHNQIWL